MNQEQEYISGLGKQSVVPPEIKGWNWGAFLLNWIWGIGNSTYIALLMFVPLVNVVMFFVLGAKGNEWAWKNRTWRNVEHFKDTQRKWRNAGLLLFFVGFPLIFLLASNGLKGDAYEQSLNSISTNAEVIELIGSPIEPGFFVMGSIETTGASGKASLQYSIIGPEGEAEAYILASKKNGEWLLHEVVVVDEKLDKTILVTAP